jgi:hypothetical protein
MHLAPVILRLVVSLLAVWLGAFGQPSAAAHASPALTRSEPLVRVTAGLLPLTAATDAMVEEREITAPPSAETARVAGVPDWPVTAAPTGERRTHSGPPTWLRLRHLQR